jgi:hypothetical protein
MKKKHIARKRNVICIERAMQNPKSREGGVPPTSLAFHDDAVQFETIDSASMLPGAGIGVSAGEF